MQDAGPPDETEEGGIDTKSPKRNEREGPGDEADEAYDLILPNGGD